MFNIFIKNENFQTINIFYYIASLNKNLLSQKLLDFMWTKFVNNKTFIFTLAAVVKKSEIVQEFLMAKFVEMEDSTITTIKPNEEFIYLIDAFNKSTAYEYISVSITCLFHLYVQTFTNKTTNDKSINDLLESTIVKLSQ